MKKIILISVITVFGFINASAYVSPQGCDWPKGNSHRADWNDDYGGYGGDYWDWRQEEAHPSTGPGGAIRNFLVNGCNVLRASYWIVYFDNAARRNGDWPELISVVDYTRRHNAWTDNKAGEYFIVKTWIQPEAGDGSMPSLANHQYPWHKDRIPCKSPYKYDWDGPNTNGWTFLVASWIDEDGNPYGGYYENNYTHYAAPYFGVHHGVYYYAFYYGDHKETIPWKQVVCFGNGIKNIGDDAFRDSRVLEVRDDMPASIEWIGSNAFYGSELQRVLIGPGVKSIWGGAFGGLGDQVRIFQSQAPNPPICYGDIFSGTSISNKTLRVPVGSINTYWHHPTFHQFQRIMDCKENYTANPEEVTMILDGRTPLTQATTDWQQIGKPQQTTQDTVQLPGTQFTYTTSLYPPIANEHYCRWDVTEGNGSVESTGARTTYTVGRRGVNTVRASALDNVWSEHQIYVKGDTVSSLNTFTVIGIDTITYPSSHTAPIKVSYFDSTPRIVSFKHNNWSSLTYSGYTTPLKIGDNKFDIKLTAEDPDYKSEYTYNIIRGDLIMNNISLDKGVIAYDTVRWWYESWANEYDPSDHEYEVTLEDYEDNITFIAQITDSLAVLSDGNYKYNYGANPPTLITASYNGRTYLTYTYHVFRKYNPNSTLRLITLNNGSIPLQFDPNKTEYNVEVDFWTQQVDIDAQLSNELASFRGDIGVRQLAVGNNTFRIKATAHDVNISTEYTINIVRLKDNDATLMSLTVDTFTLSPEFNPNTPKYYVTVPNEVSVVTVKAEGNGYVSYISGTGRLLLNTGMQKQPITVYAMDKTKKVYYIEITREGEPVLEQKNTTGLSQIEQDLPVDVFTITGIYLGKHKISNLNAFDRHKVVIVKTQNNVLKIKL